jgi:hypothetical protein
MKIPGATKSILQRNVMKLSACLHIFGLVFATVAVSGQNFTSGSTGADGALNVTGDTTIDLPPNGILNYTTINVAGSRTLRFRRNAANTPVYLLAQGAVTISGRIEISGNSGNNVVGGTGGPGGYDGGSPASVSVQPGAGYGPGAGLGGGGSTAVDGAGSGSFGTVGTLGLSKNKGAVYANALLVPLVGGSGGGGTAGTPGTGGGGGGGAILVASSTRIEITGSIIAQGGGSGGNAYNGGSGGAVRLVAPVITGGGQISVTGNGGAGSGRIRVDAIDRTQMGLGFFDASVTSVGSLMLVFPSPLPRLDVIEAAGTAIAEGSGPVLLQLPFGSSPNRTIKVQARDFNAQVPITLILTPDHGAPATYTAKIDNSGANNPAVASIDVTLPVNEQTTVQIYSK